MVQALADVIDERTGAVVLDLAGVRLLDSSGIRALLRLRELADLYDLPLVLRAPSEQARRVLRVSGVDEVFTVDRSDPDAPVRGGCARATLAG